MIGSWIKKKLYLRKWRKINSHNLVEAVNFFDISKVTVGKYSYGGIYLLDFQTESKLNIGSFCSIAPNVMFCLGAEHRVDTISSFPFKVKVMGEEAEAISKGDIIVKDDVWLGYGSIIMSGVTIGQGAVIAAGSVVTKDVPPYAIVGGIPAEVIKYRFSDDIIREMLKIDYNKLDEKIIREHIDELYQNVSTLNQLTWLPRKSNY